MELKEARKQARRAVRRAREGLETRAIQKYRGCKNCINI